MGRLKEGDKAPNFICKNKDGKEIKLTDFTDQKKPFVIFFFPNSIGYFCSREVCQFGNSYTEFTNAGVEVIGVSPQSRKSLNKFAEKNKIPFNLVVDKGMKLAKLFGVDGVLITGRVTFVVDKDGTIIMSHSLLMNAKTHIEESLKAIETLKSN